MKLLRTLLTVAALLAAGDAGAQQLAKVKVAYVPLSSSVAIFLAKDKGIFEKHGLDVEPVFMRSAVEVIPGLVSDSLQIGMLPDSSLVQAADSGIDVVALTGNSMLRSGSSESGLIARTGSDIKEPKDVKGKKIVLISIGSISQVVFEKWLMMKGVDKATIASIQYSEASLPQMVDIIKTGTVDAAVVAEPFVTAILKQGTGYVVSLFMGEMPDKTQAMLNASTSTWVAKNPKLVQAFRDSIKEATEYAIAHQDETREAIGRWLKLPPPVVQTARFPDLESTVTPSDLQWWIDVMAEQDRLRTKLDAAKLIAK
jgi:NitT/TauT family transport system substrate-binding protein